MNILTAEFLLIVQKNHKLFRTENFKRTL